MLSMKSILIIGGTGAQGAAVVRALSEAGSYEIRILTRNVNSSHAQELSALKNVELLPSSEQGHDEDSFSAGVEDADFVFVNTDGFALGEQAEIYWGIRMFELARRAGVKHFVYSSLDYLGPKTNFDPKYTIGHYQGKALVAEYMKAQPTSPMAWSAISSGPYIESLSSHMMPALAPDGETRLFQLPLGSGAVPFIHLDDFALYVKWILEHPSISTGQNLEVATAHVSGPEIAEAFTAVTGKPAKYIPISINAWIDVAASLQPNGRATKIGSWSGRDDRALLQTYEQNFTAWWETYRASARNKGIITRDYELLDRILPQRVKSVENWMRKVQYTGEKKALLKDWHDSKVVQK